MKLDRAVCYRAVLARDARYDGRFFTCVKTTGIYCRPICPARPPKVEHCDFVPTAAAAQAAGFRPCLRCRPESAPDLDAWRGGSATVSRALRMLEGGALDGENVTALAERLSIGERQLRRLFRRDLGASPITVEQTRRVLLAKQLIHQTSLPMIEVALASGFGSVRRFNETFQQLYGRPPGDLRRAGGERAPKPELCLKLPYRPPYDWAEMIRFLARRAVSGIEVVASGKYFRTIEVANAQGWIGVSHVPEECALSVEIGFPELRALPAIIARIRRMFDLSADPGAISAALGGDPVLAPLVAARPGLRLPGAWDGFELAIRAVLGQQITVEAAVRLVEGIVSEYGTPVTDPGMRPGLTHVFPKPEKLRRLADVGLPMPKARGSALVNVAETFLANPRLFDPSRDLQETVSRLREIKGVGEWTAQYIAMRALGESDAFLAGDVGVQRAFALNGRRATAAEVAARAEGWRPWRAYAVMHLWAATTRPRRTLKTEVNDALAA